jgi:hypothetical protein
MPTVSINFTTVRGTTNIVQLVGVPTSVAVINRATTPVDDGRLGWLSLRIGSYVGMEQFGVSAWYGGRAGFTQQLNANLYAAFVTQRSGLLLTFVYVTP